MPCSKLMKKVHRLPNLTSMKALTNGLMTECTGFLPRIITNKRNACIWTTHLQLILWCRPCLILTKKRVKASRNFHKTFFEILKSFSVFWPATLSKKRLVFFCKFHKIFKNIFWIKCRIPGTRPTYSPVNFTREHVGQIICLHFSNSLVNMLATSLLNMLAEALVNMVNIHWWTCWPEDWWTCWPSYWRTCWPSHWWTCWPKHW